MFREEITLALKNGGNIDNIDNYKGIFLRNVILTIFQKWLHRKNAKKSNASGSEYVFGERTSRSVQEALLIVKLVQNHAKWTKKQIII